MLQEQQVPAQAQSPTQPCHDPSQPVSHDLPFTPLQDLSTLEDGSLKQHVRSLQGSTSLCRLHSSVGGGSRNDHIKREEEEDSR